MIVLSDQPMAQTPLRFALPQITVAQWIHFLDEVRSTSDVKCQQDANYQPVRDSGKQVTI
jgi:hypothetical protein